MIKQKSFTLIELLVVIVIIGILAGVIMISTSSSIDKASIAKVKVFEESIQNNLAANMVSRWKLDEGSGTNTDDTWGNSDGTLYSFDSTSDSGWVSEGNCISGKCLKFDGLNDYVNAGNFNGLKGEKEATIAFWAKKKVNVIHAGPVSGEGGINSKILFLMLDSSNGGSDTNSFFISFCDGVNVKNLLSDHRLPIDSWEYVVATFKSKDFVKIYSNGVLNNSDGTVLERLNSNPANNLFFGVYSSFRFNGYIDDVRIYSAALSTAQIKQNYIAGLNSMLSNGNISNKEYNERINELAYDKLYSQ